MLSWLRRGLDRAAPATEGSAEIVPEWAEQLAERLLKAVRAQSKASLRLDELERKVDNGFDRILARLDEDGELEPGLSDLFDAADLLETVVRTHAARDPALAEGLEGVLARLDRFFSAKNLQRIPAVGDLPNGGRVRVVGTLADSSLPAGAVTRVVRSAIVCDDTLIREGEVLVNPGSS